MIHVPFNRHKSYFDHDKPPTNRVVTAAYTTKVHFSVTYCVKGAENRVQNSTKTLKTCKMCKNDLHLSVLPDDLQDLVFKFAYGLPKDQVLCSLYAILDIIDMQLPFFFFRKKIWSWDLKRFLHNPIWVFEPMEYYQCNFNSLFDEDAMYCLLIGLDFRRKNVRLFGSREKWLSRICTSWRAVEPFAAYYRMLMRSKSPIMKKRGILIRGYI